MFCQKALLISMEVKTRAEPKLLTVSSVLGRGKVSPTVCSFSMRKSIHMRRTPGSFFLAIPMPDAQGDRACSLTPSSSRAWTCSSVCLLGIESPRRVSLCGLAPSTRSILCSMRWVHPKSYLSLAKAKRFCTMIPLSYATSSTVRLEQVISRRHVPCPQQMLPGMIIQRDMKEIQSSIAGLEEPLFQQNHTTYHHRHLGSLQSS